MTKSSTHIPRLDLFLEVNRQQLKDSSHSLSKDICLRDKNQTKGLRLLLCNMYIQGQRQVMVSRRKQPCIC
jgi:peptide subunit release factor 1 (eRF1)